MANYKKKKNETPPETLSEYLVEYMFEERNANRHQPLTFELEIDEYRIQTTLSKN